jgi:GNAT superfamily N-acetyltransferase
MQTQTTAPGTGRLDRPVPGGTVPRTVPAEWTAAAGAGSGFGCAAPPAADPVAGGRVSIRPVAAADAAELRRFLACLSAETVHRRFFTGIGMIGERLLESLLRPGDGGAALVALHDGRIVAHAMYAPMPAGDHTADLGVVVADEWQRHGLGPRLINALLALAEARGVRTIGFSVLLGNRPANKLATRSWPQAPPVAEQGLYEYRIPLAAAGTEPAAP